MWCESILYVLLLFYPSVQSPDKIEAGEEGRCADREGELVPLEMFDYGNDKLGCLILESLDQLHFLGISVSSLSLSESRKNVWERFGICDFLTTCMLSSMLTWACIRCSYKTIVSLTVTQTTSLCTCSEKCVVLLSVYKS